MRVTRSILTIHPPGPVPADRHGHRGRPGGAGVQESVPDLSADQERFEEAGDEEQREAESGCGHGGVQLPTGLREGSEQ